MEDTDLAEFISARLAARTAKAHAAFYEAQAESVRPDPDLGSYAEQAATELRRAYCAIALTLLRIADEAAGRAATYRVLMSERSA